MPATFIYFVAMPVWILLACLVWLLAGVMALNRATRRKGLALALAMAATFPSVFLFLVEPFLAIIYALVILPLILMYPFALFERPRKSQLIAISQAVKRLKCKLCNAFIRVFVDFQ